MTENRINFYLGKLGNEDWICSCDELDLMGEPNKGDLVWLPLDVPDEEREMYVVMQKYISDNISQMMKLAISASHIIGRIERMEFLLRYFIDGNVDCEGHVWSYTHAARMIIPRIGERVWVDDNTCVEVDMVTYSPDYYDGDKLYSVEIECHNITDDVLAECDDEEDY